MPARHGEVNGERRGRSSGEIGGVVSDRDIWRKARALIEQYCDKALAQAELRADALRAEGDLDGQRVWNRVLVAIREIRG
jgi:hypothetical protein